MPSSYAFTQYIYPWEAHPSSPALRRVCLPASPPLFILVKIILGTGVRVCSPTDRSIPDLHVVFSEALQE